MPNLYLKGKTSATLLTKNHMLPIMFRTSAVVAFCCVLFSCAPTRNTSRPSTEIRSLKFINAYEIPFDFKYENTQTGGLSGIDYDQTTNVYYLISDDRSERSPARFYTANIFLTTKGIDSLVFTGMKYLLQPDGTVFPGVLHNRFKTPDPESIRYNPITGQLIWSSEGERTLKKNDTVLINPAIMIMDKNGSYIDSFELPPNLRMQAVEKGPRKNGTIEGLSFADNFKSVFISMEEPLYEDGPRAGLTDNNAFIRIIKFNIGSRKSNVQYAYKLEPVAHAAIPANEFKINGVPEILDLGNDKLLVMERSFSTGIPASTIKLFIADLKGATNISNLSLKENTTFSPAKKTLLLNMDELKIYIDNIEGVCFGPRLLNGNRTLIFAADNNFNEKEKAQVLLFEVIE